MSKFYSELTWDKINWGNSYNIVRSLQRRIFRASRLGDIKLVRHLQQRLIRSPHAKLIAVQQVTTLNKGKNTPGVDGFVPTKPGMKLTLAKNLHLNGKASYVRRVWIPKPGKDEKKPLGIPTIQDRAKQALAKLAIEPEWEAKFEPNSYGFRPGRSCHDAIEAIFSNLRHKVDKLVYDADICKCFERIDHDALIAKLDTFPLMERQINAWLKAGIMEEFANRNKEAAIGTTQNTRGTPQGGVISPLLANIALHGLEEHLKNYVSSRDFPKPHPDASNGTKTKRSALGVIRYADDFVLIHQNAEIMEKVILETKAWLAGVGLEISKGKTKLRRASQPFKFLGFQILLVIKQGKYKVKITPTKESVKRLTDKTRNIIQNNKSSSSYGLIYLLRPVLIGWGNYFQYCECKETFKKVDNVIYNQIRAWVFRRATRQGRMAVKQKYFPENRTYKFENRIHQGNWILSGKRYLKNGKLVTAHLPKISWISSKKHIKILSDASVYDGNHLYWAERCPRYSILTRRVKYLLKRQKGYCTACERKFTIDDIMEVDHIIPRSKGGLDQYNNLQLLHRQCHVMKTKIDLRSEPKTLAGAG